MKLSFFEGSFPFNIKVFIKLFINNATQHVRALLPDLHGNLQEQALNTDAERAGFFSVAHTEKYALLDFIQDLNHIDFTSSESVNTYFSFYAIQSEIAAGNIKQIIQDQFQKRVAVWQEYFRKGYNNNANPLLSVSRLLKLVEAEQDLRK